MKRLAFLSFILSFTTACGNGGSVIFAPDAQPSTANSRPTGYTLVPGSQALMLQSGHVSTATGYHAKVQLNSIGGTKMSSPSSHQAVIKFTTR
jgi:hypothetical protein